MGAPKGTNFWNQRTRVGRKKLFEKPSTILREAYKYFQWCDENPLLVQDFKGKDATEVTINKMRPYTMAGLCVFLNVHRGYLSKLEYQDPHVQKEFTNVLAHVKQIMFTQKFEGAAAGLFNQAIISQELGLRTVTDVNVDDKRKEISQLFPDESELNDSEPDEPNIEDGDE